MKRIQLLMVIVTLMVISQVSFGQGQSQRFKMEGINPETIAINQTFTTDAEIFPFEKNVNKVFGVAVTAEIAFKSDKSVVRLLFVDKDYKEHLIYEAYPLLEESENFSVEEICEETAILNGAKAHSVKIEITDAQLTLKSFTYTKALGQGVYSDKLKKEKKLAQNEEKISRINKSLKEKGLHWVAGLTEVSEMTYSERQLLYGQSTFPSGFEYYTGGVLSTGSSEQLKSAAASSYVDDWDWRNRHGKNWISPVTNQGSCGSCWAFAATGATEALVNLFYNQQLNLNLSEQDVLSCSGGGSCNGGYPSTALNYITKTGIVDEAAFPYSGTDQNCSDKGNNPSEIIKIGGKIDFGSTIYPKTEDDLKRMLIQMGPVSGGLYDWSHAMVLVGYKVVMEADKFYYRDLDLKRYWITIAAEDPLIGKTVWIFKNSWGAGFGDEGYVYVETPITNFGWTHALKTPITSVIKSYQVICEDRDGDGYYCWGLGPKPVTCNCPDSPDGNDADPTLGPLDQYGNCMVLGGIPTANFSASKTVINKGETVTFTDLSTNSPVSWSWSFAGGTPLTSTSQNPVVTYNTAGTYQVTLTATNAAGSNTKTITNYIQVIEPVLTPVANFSADKTIITKGETVTFTDLTSNSPDSWSWSFAGGTPLTSNSRNPVVTYNTAGTYKVVLTASNSSGSTTKTEESYIQVNEPVVIAPVAEFAAAKTSILVGENVQFTDLSENQPTQWEWSFPGGTPANSTAQNPKVTYNVAGEYDVTLTVSKQGSASSKNVKFKYIVTIENKPAEYCKPVAITSSPDYIKSVVIGTVLNQTTTGSGYSLTENAVVMVPGKSYSVSLTPQVLTNRNYWRIWIDFNSDGDFNDAGETLVTVNNKKGAVKTSFIVPQTATGQTRMRIAMRTSAAPAQCDDNYKGEVEDYYVTFGMAASSGNESTEIVASSGIESPEMIATSAENTDIEISGNIKFYPNPVNHALHLNLETTQPGDFYTIYNINGGKVVSDKITSTITTIDFGSYSPGIYMLSVINGECVYNERIIKK